MQHVASVAFLMWPSRHGWDALALTYREDEMLAGDGMGGVIANQLDAPGFAR